MIKTIRESTEFYVETKKFKQGYVCESTNQMNGSMEICKKGGGKFKVISYDDKGKRVVMESTIIYLQDIKEKKNV